MTKLDKSLDEITKKYGAGSVFKLGGDVLKVEAISTGLPSLDAALGVGGIPKGRIIEMTGWESSGKTSMCLRIIAEVQKQGGLCAIIDTENALERGWCKICGVDVDNLYISQPSTAEDAMTIIEILVESKVFDLVVLDSVSALLCRAELEGSIGDAHVGLQSRLMSSALRKLHGPIKQTNTIVIFLNQYRHKIGGYGSPNVGSGGESLKFYASVRLELARIQTITEGGVAIGNKHKITVKKNKVAPPFKECEVRLYFDQGLDPVADTMLFALEKGLVEKRGSWFSYGELKGQGETNFINLLRENVEVYNDLKLKLTTV